LIPDHKGEREPLMADHGIAVDFPLPQ